MKKLYLYTVFAAVLVLFLSSCVKEYPVNNGYWSSQESGQVVYSSPNCDHYIVETANGYTVIRAISNMPYEGDILYGDFSNYGIEDIYDQSGDVVMTGEVTDYWLSYDAAQQALVAYCGAGVYSFPKGNITPKTHQASAPK